jgi:hypothetical protein
MEDLHENTSEQYEDNGPRNTHLKKHIARLNNGDGNYVELKRRNHKNQNKTIGCYRSGPAGTTICNAATGIKYYGHLVGSLSEDLYFKVCIATGEGGGEDPLVLFYDSPEEYERHAFVSISDLSKQNFLNKRDAMMKHLNK